MKKIRTHVNAKYKINEVYLKFVPGYLDWVGAYHPSGLAQLADARCEEFEFISVGELTHWQFGTHKRLKLGPIWF